MLTAIVGINWGDEGKGRMVDLLSSDYEIICRYQGGNNAGHTVVNDKGKFILNLLPSGILRETTVNVMGNGMVIDLEHLNGEISNLAEKGIKISPDNLKISDKAIICLPYHKQQDILEEERLADKKFGSTRRGIAPVYAGKFPFWLAPVQVKILPISEKFTAYADHVKAALTSAGFRTEVDERSEKIGYKIREARNERVPYIVVVGEKEEEEDTVSIRKRDTNDDMGAMSIPAFIDMLKTEENPLK